MSALLRRRGVRTAPSIALFGLALTACAGGEVYSADDGPSFAEEPAPLPAPDTWPELACDGGPAAPFADRITLPGTFFQMQMGECGGLTWIDGASDLFRMSPRLEDPERLATGVTQWRANRRQDAFLVAEGRAWSYVEPGAAPGPAVEATSVGFFRDGDVEHAWACVGGELGTLDLEGFHPRVSDVRLCERAIAASDAPVIAFVGSDFLPRAFHFGEDRLYDLSEVAYIAASSDRLALSPDGRILFHEPATVPQPRIGVFDLERPVGDRLVGAPRILGGLSGLRRAPGAGHAAGMATEEGAVLLGADGVLRIWEDARLLSVAPGGAGLLLTAQGGLLFRNPWDVFLAAPGRPRRPLGTIDAPLTSVTHSPEGRAFVGWGRDETDRFALGFYVRFTWEDEALVELTRQSRLPYWVGEDGASITRTDDGADVRASNGNVVRRYIEVWNPFPTSLSDGRVLLWLRESERSRLLVVSTDTGDEETLYDGAPLRTVVADRDGTRVAALRWEPDPEDETMLRTVIAAGAAR